MAGNQKGAAGLFSTAIELPFVEKGTGDPVVFVHGSNSDHRIWNAHCEAISSRYRMIMITQRYFGTGPWPDSGEGFCNQVHADDLAAFIRGLGAGPVDVVGWSLGGGVCLTMACQHSDLVRRMFLYEPALATFVTAPDDAKATVDDRIVMTREAKSLADAGDYAGAVRVFMDSVDDRAGTFADLSPEVRAMMTENARMLPLLFAGPPQPNIAESDLRELEVPVTIAMGARTRLFYQVVARTAHKLLPHCDLRVVEGARHLWPIQNPPAFSRLVLGFLAPG